MINVNEILLYTTKDGEIKIDVLYGDQNIWLTQKKMALLFGVQIPAINKHLKNISFCLLCGLVRKEIIDFID